jgi:hypothetical protein
MIRSAVQDPAALDRFREDALAAGAELGDPAGETVAATPSTPRVPAPIPS